MLLKMRRSARFAPTVFSGANSIETRQSTHPSPRQLAALALGKLAPEARDRLQAHVSACAACTTFLAQTPPETLQSLLQQSTAPRNAAEQSTPSAQRPQATNPAASLLRAKPLAAAPSRQAPPHIADDSIPRELREQTKYRIVRLLGRGGMGSVYEVHHERMDRRQALKVINPELVDNPQRFCVSSRSSRRLPSSTTRTSPGPTTPRVSARCRRS